jgi:hypothetical protein
VDEDNTTQIKMDSLPPMVQGKGVRLPKVMENSQ